MARPIHSRTQALSRAAFTGPRHTNPYPTLSLHPHRQARTRPTSLSLEASIPTGLGLSMSWTMPTRTPDRSPADGDSHLPLSSPSLISFFAPLFPEAQPE